MTMKEKAAQRMQRTYHIRTEITPDGEYVIDNVSAGNTAREAEKLARQFYADDVAEEEREYINSAGGIDNPIV